jgi:hypothetical protein
MGKRFNKAKSHISKNRGRYGLGIFVFIVVLCLILWAAGVFTPSNKKTVENKPSQPSQQQSNGCVNNWKYKKSDDTITGPYTESTKEGDNKDWCMMPAYKSGGKAWKYTDDPNDSECLNNWTYYDKDYNVILDKISNITMKNDDKNWCPTKIYTAGGKENKEWKYI